MANMVRGSMESIENMGPQMKGITERIQSQNGYWCIVGENGKSYHFRFVHCVDGIDTFNKMKDGMSVTFNECTRTLKGEIKENSWLAMNVAIDTSGEATTLTKQTEDTVAGILDSSGSKEVVADSPECSLEDEAFRVDSTNWNETTVEDSQGNLLTIKVNQSKDICELPNGVQLFTPVSMARELILSGRVQDMMTGDQAQWLLKNTPNNIPEGCEFAGFINSKDGKLHFNGETACYWIGESNEKGNPKALFCIDINKVDEEMRPYTDEMIISDYDMESMMQVRLLKSKMA